MPIVRLALLVIAALLCLMGLVWIGQGSGIFPYPASSFMIRQPIWMVWGLVAALVGAGLAWATRRM